MLRSGDTFKTAARTGVAVNAFGLGATGALQIGNFALTETPEAAPTQGFGAVIK